MPAAVQVIPSELYSASWLPFDGSATNSPKSSNQSMQTSELPLGVVCLVHVTPSGLVAIRSVPLPFMHAANSPSVSDHATPNQLATVPGTESDSVHVSPS